MSKTYGKQVQDIMNGLIDGIYQAREGPDRGTVSISAHHQGTLRNLRKVCEAMAASPHKKTRELGVEFLNDWEAIFRVLEYPAWPLTNNEAERALRHWVIMRKITQGTNSEQGSLSGDNYSDAGWVHTRPTLIENCWLYVIRSG